MQDNLVKELTEIGLTEKEARVYLAALDLGSATAQQIATKATVERPSTYLAIESLKKKGLMSEYKKGKKIFFQASTPEQLDYILSNQQRILIEKKQRVKKIISSIERKINYSETAVQHVKGMDGVACFQDEVIEMDSGDEILEFVDLDISKKFIPENVYADDFRQKINAKHNIKLLCPNDIRKRGVILGESTITKKFDHDGELGAELIIHGNNATFIVYGEELSTITLRSKQIVDTLKALFLHTWNNANKFE